MSGINGIHVVSTRNYSATRSGIVLNDTAYGLVSRSVESGGESYEDIALSRSIAKTCWIESDSSAQGVSVIVVASEGLLIAKDSKQRNTLTFKGVIFSQ